MKFLYGSTKNADMLYALGLHVYESAFFIDKGKEKRVFLDSLDFGFFNGKNKNKKIGVEPFHVFAKRARLNKDKVGFRAKLVFEIIAEKRLLKKEIVVPADFPLDIAEYLMGKGVKIKNVENIYPERAVKTKQEIKNISGALQRTTKAFIRVEEILKESVIEGKHVCFKGRILTSEFLKKEASKVFAENDLLPTEGMIISCALQSAIPHHAGQGPILAHQPLIVDLFPRDIKTGYFADMTRTYVKGKPSARLRKMYDAVCEAQEAAFKKIKAGVKVADVHKACVKVFAKRGFHSGEKGFIHSTGHGLGLELHEQPHVGLRSELLQNGNVITVEPGLYYHKIGGVRIEDVVLVTKNGYRKLVSYPCRNFFP